MGAQGIVNPAATLMFFMQYTESPFDGSTLYHVDKYNTLLCIISRIKIEYRDEYDNLLS